jgi:hypothetical protein
MRQSLEVVWRAGTLALDQGASPAQVLFALLVLALVALVVAVSLGRVL